MNLYLHHQSAVGSRRNYTQLRLKEEFSPSDQKTIIYLVQIHHLLWFFAC